MTHCRCALLILWTLVASACGLLDPDGENPEKTPLPGLVCRRLEVPAGPEDLVIDHERGLAWIASTDRRALENGRDDAQVGFLSRLDLRTDRPRAVDVTPNALRHPDFRPQGLGLLPGERPRLLVVDRRPAGPGAASCALDNAIRIFEIEDQELRLARTISDPERLVRLNDVEPLDGIRFFATSDHGTRSCISRNLRDLFGLNRGHLLLFDGERFAVAVEGLPFANGLAFDRVRQTLYVAASGSGTIHSFDLGRAPPFELEPRGAIRLDRSPDNLSLGPAGDLLLAAHPDRFRFMLFQRGWLGADIAPTSILEIDGRASPPQLREVFADDGMLISAASVAARFVWRERDLVRLLIGQVFGDRLLLCDRPGTDEETAPE